MRKEETNQGPPGHTPVTFHLWPGSDTKSMTWLSGYELNVVRPVLFSQLRGTNESQ